MKRIKGFTLVELLAVIAILIIIVLLSSPTLISVLKNNKEKAYNKTVDIIESAAIDYVIDNGMPSNRTICIDELCDEEYLSCPIMDVRDDVEMNGCVEVDNNNNYTYSE